MLMRFDPFRDLERWVAQQPGTVQRPGFMPLDAYRHGDHYVVHFDLPGVDQESIELTVDKNVLSVSAERSWTPEEGDQVLMSERPQGHYARQLLLGDTLAPDGIEARYDKGVLTVTIPVAESAKPRKVQITSGNQKSEAITTGSRRS